MTRFGADDVASGYPDPAGDRQTRLHAGEIDVILEVMEIKRRTLGEPSARRAA